MKQRTRVTKSRKKNRRKPLSLKASVEEPKEQHPNMEEILGLYRPRKQVVTLRLDADMVAWFKKPGHGYQTRINRALRRVMREEKEKAER